MDMEGFRDKADEALTQGEEEVDERTGGRFDEQTDRTADEVRERAEGAFATSRQTSPSSSPGHELDRPSGRAWRVRKAHTVGRGPSSPGRPDAGGGVAGGWRRAGTGLRGDMTQPPGRPIPPAAGVSVCPPVTPAGWLTFLGRSVGGVRPTLRLPGTAHRPRRPGCTIGERPGPGSGPGGEGPRGHKRTPDEDAGSPAWPLQPGRRQRQRPAHRRVGRGSLQRRQRHRRANRLHRHRG
jgi:hypothetical protein